MAKKKLEGGKKKVSKKKKSIQRWKYLKDIYAELDNIKERLDLIEWFLGGKKSMEKVKEDNE